MIAVYVQSLVYSRPMDMFVWLTNDGRAYAATLRFDTRVRLREISLLNGIYALSSKAVR